MFIGRVLTLIAALTLALSTAHAEVVANFTDGLSTTAVDGFEGMPGNGWKTPWVKKQSNTTSESVTISQASPLKAGAGNYLNVSFSSTGAAPANSSSVIVLSRQYNGDGGAATSKPVKYQFLFRTESNNTDYRYMIYESPSAGAGTGPQCTWIINGIAGFWRVFNGNREGAGKDTDTKVAITPNTTYLFTIIANPADFSWSVVIADASTGATLYDSKASGQSLQFRTKETTLGGFISLGLTDATSDKTPNSYAFSFDSVSINNN